MNLNHLQTFRILAETLSFTETAKRLSTVQPAVSRQIKSLEEDLGYRIFSRSRQAVALTPEGAKLLTRVSRSLDELDLAFRPEKDDGEPRGDLYVGSAPDAGIQYLWSRLLLLQKEFPLIRVHLKLGPSSEVLERVERGTYAFGMVTSPPKGKSYHLGPFVSDPLVLVQSRHSKHRDWTKRDVFEFVTYGPNDTYTSELIRRHLSKGKRKAVVTRSTINSHLGMIEAVVKNDWLAVIPKSSATGFANGAHIEIVAESKGSVGFQLVCTESFLARRKNQKIWEWISSEARF